MDGKFIVIRPDAEWLGQNLLGMQVISGRVSVMPDPMPTVKSADNLV
jgi:hypothetical protein